MYSIVLSKLSWHTMWLQYCAFGQFFFFGYVCTHFLWCLDCVDSWHCKTFSVTFKFTTIDFRLIFVKWPIFTSAWCVEKIVHQIYSLILFADVVHSLYAVSVLKPIVKTKCYSFWTFVSISVYKNSKEIWST